MRNPELDDLADIEGHAWDALRGADRELFLLGAIRQTRALLYAFAMSAADQNGEVDSNEKIWSLNDLMKSGHYMLQQLDAMRDEE